jgi:hypothetical protein
VSTELAWAAGFFDGEGSFTTSLDSYGYKHARVCVSQNTRELLDRFAVAVGTGKVYGPHSYKQSCPYMWVANGPVKTRLVFELLDPYLGSVKRAQAERVLAESRPPRVLKTHCPRGHSYAEVGQHKNRNCRKCQNIKTVERNRRVYAERQALGLTVFGKPRKNKIRATA